MRRAKIGDVYYFKVSNGYKLVQWAYHIPKQGRYLRVLEGLYDSIPSDIATIVKGSHSYIISFHILRAYRIGLAQWLGNYPVPEAYPFPKFSIEFWPDKHYNVFSIWLTPMDCSITGNRNILSFDASCMADLPEMYRGEKLLSSCVSPDWLLFLFDYNFTLEEPKRFWPQNVLGDTWEEKFKEYQETVDRALEQDKIAREKLNLRKNKGE